MIFTLSCASLYLQIPNPEKVRRFLYRELPYRTRSERPMRSTVVDLMPFRRQMFVTVVP